MGEAKQRAERFRHGVVIQCLGLIGRVMVPDGANPAGLYLKFADFEFQDGRGHVEWTGKVEDAQVFPDSAHALEFWKTVPKARPIRPDGLPNRPLTAFSVELLPAPPPGFKSRAFDPGFAL